MPAAQDFGLRHAVHVRSLVAAHFPARWWFAGQLVLQGRHDTPVDVESLSKYPEAHRHWPIDVAPAAFVPANGGQGSQVKSPLPPHEPTEYWFLRQDVGLRHGAHLFEVEALPEDTM